MKDQLEFNNDYPGDRGIITDNLCYHFSVPIFIAVLFVFFGVLITGFKFSFMHPENEKGFRCGINNDVYGAIDHDFTHFPYVILNGSNRYCSNACTVRKFFRYCIPTDAKNIKKLPYKFKLVDDFLSYWKYIVIFSAVVIVLSIPVYLICAKLTSIIFTLSIFLSILLTAITSVFAIKYKFYSSFSYLLTLTFGLIILFVYFRKNIRAISPMVSVSVDYFKRVPSILLVAPILILGGLFAFFFVVFGYLFSRGVGDAVVTGNRMTIESHGSLVWTIILFILAGQWFYEFLRTLLRMAVARIVCHLYFQKQPPRLSESILHILKYHTGTVFLGSFVIYLLSDLVYLLQRLRKYAEKIENRFVRFIIKCITTCFILITKIAGDINRLSFVFTALKGVSFWDSCKWALDAVTDVNFAATEVIVFRIFWFVKISIVLTFSAIAYFISSYIGLFYSSLFVAIVYISIFYIVDSVETVLFASCESILVCAREDVKIHGAQNAIAPPQLWEVVTLFGNGVPQHVVDQQSA